MPSKKAFNIPIVIFSAIGICLFLAYVFHDENPTYLVGGGLSAIIITTAGFFKNKTI